MDDTHVVHFFRQCLQKTEKQRRILGFSPAPIDVTRVRINAASEVAFRRFQSWRSNLWLDAARRPLRTHAGQQVHIDLVFVNNGFVNVSIFQKPLYSP